MDVPVHALHKEEERESAKRQNPHSVEGDVSQDELNLQARG